jgi:hypothetical protein
MKEQNRLRIERLVARYAGRVGAAADPEEATFIREFVDLRERVIRPVLDECAASLREAGHDARVVLDEGPDTPSIELALGLRGGKGASNKVGFHVLRWKGYPLQILAYLEVSPPPFDLERFARAEELAADRVEQMVVDAIEHIMMTNAP